MDPASLAREIETFLAKAPEGVVREKGQVLFDLATAKYSISAERGKCLIQFWSEERNIVRHALDASIKSGNLQVKVHRLGQPKPSTLEICRDRNSRRTAGPGTSREKTSVRQRYAECLQTALRRRFPDWKLEGATSAMDLEHSFGPAYVRGTMSQGKSCFAFVGVNREELPATVNGALTIAILWLDLCRQRETRRMFEGVRLFLPKSTGGITQTRMSYLNPEAAKWQLFEFTEDSGEISPLQLGDHGNIATKLSRCPDHKAVCERFAASISRVVSLVPAVEIVVQEEHEVAFRLNGLEFARVRMVPEAGTFRRRQQTTFGSGANETELTDKNQPEFQALMVKVFKERQPDGNSHSQLWRMQPERWLESIATANAARIDQEFEGSPVYSQVPAFAASDRGLIDMLTCTHHGRLAVIELKAEEDLHLPLQGLDYWARVKWHHEQAPQKAGVPGEFQRFGYFSGRVLSQEAPLLYLVAPALHIHPATDTLLRYFSPAIEWRLVGVDERWRHGLKGVFTKRKHSSVGAQQSANTDSC